MARFFPSLLPAHQEFISKQHLFFVATAPLDPGGHINLSPKGLDTFRVISDKQVAYLDFIGSGNETSAHTLENGRITLMFCAFEGPPNILRIYGRGKAVLPDSPEWGGLSGLFAQHPNTRQILVIEVQEVATSCGYGVPLYTYTGERRIMQDWADRKGPDGMREYIQEKNLKSLDGLVTDWGTRG
ncbi:MAG TPA: pyridoxamine 5'-phosphate oxidase family protein [Saprospiraceae bacterium]|nr:pyridoxamine 5'-phosphate oxidase family protein [Saprospiraceae bacterium]